MGFPCPASPITLSPFFISIVVSVPQFLPSCTCTDNSFLTVPTTSSWLSMIHSSTRQQEHTFKNGRPIKDYLLCDYIYDIMEKAKLEEKKKKQCFPEPVSQEGY